MLFRSNTLLIVEGVMPYFLHIIPVVHDAMFNGVLQGQDASFRLCLITYIGIFLAHPNHHTCVPRAANYARKHCSRRVITGKASLRGEYGGDRGGCLTVEQGHIRKLQFCSTNDAEGSRRQSNRTPRRKVHLVGDSRRVRLSDNPANLLRLHVEHQELAMIIINQILQQHCAAPLVPKVLKPKILTLQLNNIRQQRPDARLRVYRRLPRPATSLPPQQLPNEHPEPADAEQGEVPVRRQPQPRPPGHPVVDGERDQTRSARADVVGEDMLP
ncbi:hypothetical protein EJB05_03386, partial [Eragrostis curvula]